MKINCKNKQSIVFLLPCNFVKDARQILRFISLTPGFYLVIAHCIVYAVYAQKLRQS